MDLGDEYSVYTGYFEVKASGDSGGHLVYFRFSNNLVFRKCQVFEQSIHLNLDVIQFYAVIVCHLVKQRKKALGLLVINE